MSGIPPKPFEGVRDFTVAVFVVWEEQVLLHEHAALQMWLPPGGHIEPNELPDDAAVRETYEEAGVVVELVGEPPITAPGPRQLARPRGVQLERVRPGHEHVDLVYLAKPLPGYDGRLRSEGAAFGWFTARAASLLTLTPEVAAWVELALDELGAGKGAPTP